MKNDRMLQEAIDAAQLGQRSRARDLLTRLLQDDKDNATYWVYMSAVVDSPKERIYCLESALKLDPKNETAKQGLIFLGGLPPDDSITPVKPASNRDWDVGKIGGVPGSAPEEKGPKINFPVRNVVTLLFVGFVSFGLIIFGIVGNPFATGPRITYVQPTLKPLASAGPSATFLPTDTPTVRTATPTFVGPTPLVFLLDAPFTATPLYVNTPHPSSDAFSSGMRAMGRGEYETAIALFKQVIELDPGAADVRYQVGEAYMYLEEYLLAKDAFNKAVSVNPNFAPGYLGRVRANINLLNFNIIEDLNQAINLDSNYTEAYIQRAAYFISRDNPAAALIDILLAEELITTAPDLYFFKAKALIALEEYAPGLEAALRANSLDITNEETYLLMGVGYYETGQTEHAIGPLQTYLLFQDQDAAAWLLLGQAYQLNGFLENALVAFEKVDSLDTTLYEINYYRGVTYLDLGDYDSAIPNLRNAVRIYPNWFEPSLALGRAIFLSGDVGNGYLAIETAYSLAFDDDELAVAYYWRALSLESVGEVELALADWQSLLDLPAEVVPDSWAILAQSRISNGVPAPTPTPAEPSPSPTP